jgi:hypothetical protein
MLDVEFKKQRAKTARELAAIALDPFIKKRLLALAARYDDESIPVATARPQNQKVPNGSTSSER